MTSGVERRWAPKRVRARCTAPVLNWSSAAPSRVTAVATTLTTKNVTAAAAPAAGPLGAAPTST